MFFDECNFLQWCLLTFLLTLIAQKETLLLIWKCAWACSSLNLVLSHSIDFRCARADSSHISSLVFGIDWVYCLPKLVQFNSSCALSPGWTTCRTKSFVGRSSLSASGLRSFRVVDDSHRRISVGSRLEFLVWSDEMSQDIHMLQLLEHLRPRAVFAFLGRAVINA